MAWDENRLSKLHLCRCEPLGPGTLPSEVNRLSRVRVAALESGSRPLYSLRPRLLAAIYDVSGPPVAHRSAPYSPALYGDGDRSLDTPGKEFSLFLKDVRAECQLFGRRDGPGTVSFYGIR